MISALWAKVAPSVAGSWGGRVRDPGEGTGELSQEQCVCLGGTGALTAQGKNVLPTMELFQCLTTNAAILAHAS